MAIFHLSAKVISRGAGQSVVAAAAYQARERLYNEQDGLTKNYTRHGQQELLESGIFAPKGAPDWVFDRERLWNAAEAAEDQHNKTRAKDAQTARHFEMALPHELDPEQNRRLVQDFVRDSFTRKGFVCDVAIHGPDTGGDSRNVHVHILVTLRTLNQDGFSAQKPRLGQAEQRAQLEHWRENWARQTARHLERAGFRMEAARMVYAHRTLDEQRQIAEARGDHEHAEALTHAPTLHEGPTATQMRREGRGPDSWRVSFNEQAADNRERLKTLRTELNQTEATLEHVYTANSPQGRAARLARVHEWQRDRLERQQARERLRQADGHAWARRDKARTASPLGQAWSEQERNAESAALERDLEAARHSLEREQEARRKLQNWQDVETQRQEQARQQDAQRRALYGDRPQPTERAPSLRERIRRMNQSDAAREHEDAQARYYQSVLREQRPPPVSQVDPSPPPSETTSAHAERLARRIKAINRKRRENMRDFDHTRDRTNEPEP